MSTKTFSFFLGFTRIKITIETKLRTHPSLVNGMLVGKQLPESESGGLR